MDAATTAAVARRVVAERLEPPTGWAVPGDPDAVARSFSLTQQGVLARLGAPGAVLVRLPGGFWTVRGAAVNSAGIPEWWVGWATVRALDARGVLVRLAEHPEGWRDARRLVTPADRAKGD